ncbi:LYRM1 [Cordylochernes scorpioides]|uniref:LYRM1 n=1 Tax=Cordylochernes scorpioides TaxID=51811 RepID=A0ABY6KC36_9ARAC|nr:LYRM1 [Cordylochernes scorpioides]
MSILLAAKQATIPVSSMRTKVLGLYKHLMRVGQTWESKSGKPKDTRDERMYILNETQRLFRQNMNIKDPEVIKSCILEAESRLVIAEHYKNPYPRPVHLPHHSLADPKYKKFKLQKELRKLSKPIYTRSIDPENTKKRTKRWPLCLFFNFLDVVAINSAVIYKAVKQDGGMARKDFIKQLALQLMRDAFKMRNQVKNLSRDLQVLRKLPHCINCHNTFQTASNRKVLFRKLDMPKLQELRVIITIHPTSATRELVEYCKDEVTIFIPGRDGLEIRVRVHQRQQLGEKMEIVRGEDHILRHQHQLFLDIQSWFRPHLERHNTTMLASISRVERRGDESTPGPPLCTGGYPQVFPGRIFEDSPLGYGALAWWGIRWHWYLYKKPQKPNDDSESNGESSPPCNQPKAVANNNYSSVCIHVRNG